MASAFMITSLVFLIAAGVGWGLYTEAQHEVRRLTAELAAAEARERAVAERADSNYERACIAEDS